MFLSFVVFVVVASGATVYKSGADERKVRWQTDKFSCTSLLFEFYSRDGVLAFKTNDILQQANSSALVILKSTGVTCANFKMMLREIEHLNFPSRESTRILVRIVNRWGTKILSFRMAISKIIALKFL